MPVFVKASRRARAYVRGGRKKSRFERLKSIARRYNAASASMNSLPGPSTGIYGTGHTQLDKAYSRASSVMGRVQKHITSKKKLYKRFAIIRRHV